MRFDFATANRIVFGPGTVAEAGAIAKSFGRRALVVTGRDSTRAQALTQNLTANGVSTVICSIIGEPSVEAVQAGVRLAKSEQCDSVVAFGGGSPIDAGKAIAAMLSNPGELLDYIEVIGAGQTLTHASVPFVAIPTTAGTGSEVTRNAVLFSPSHKLKASLRSAFLLPRVALVDPELTYATPPAVTANSGLDALTQLIEPFVCCRANPLTDALCREGMTRASRSLGVAFHNANDGNAREDMAVASLFGGLALANAGLGAVHGFANPIGGLISAPHGAICAALLPHVMRVNLRALAQRQPASPIIERYHEVARLLTGNSTAKAQEAVDWLQALCRELQIAPLRSFGLTPLDIAPLVEHAKNASSMKANPVVLTAPELAEVLESAL